MIESFLVISLLGNLFLIVALQKCRSFSVELRQFLNSLKEGNLGVRMRPSTSFPASQVMEDLNDFAVCLKKKTDEQRELRVHFEATLKSIPEGVILLDESGHIRFANKAVEENLGIRADVGEGLMLSDVLDLPGIQGLFGKRRLEGGLQKEEFFHQKTAKHIELKVSPIYIRGGSHYIGAVIISRDISKEKVLYETRRDFVANVSHELKTPITSIKGYTETLLDGALEDTAIATKFLSTVKSQSERMEQLIKDLLTLSKIEMGAMPMDTDMVNPMKIVTEVFSLVSGKADQKKLYLKKSCNFKNFHIDADANRLFQIINNLVTNAINYTDKGGITVELRKKQKGSLLRIIDTGVGIPKESIARLGERFFRVDSSRSRDQGGTGLGLAIVKHLVSSHGWQMKVTSELNKGTTVEIAIPE